MARARVEAKCTIDFCIHFRDNLVESNDVLTSYMNITREVGYSFNINI